MAYSRYILDTCPEGLRKTMKKLKITGIRISGVVLTPTA
jgi:hypothetical protein